MKNAHPGKSKSCTTVLHFNEMAEPKLNKEEDFHVKESRSINFLAGGIMLAVFFVSMAFGDYGWSNYMFALCLFLIPGAIAIAKGRRNATIMTINKSGFYYAGKRITDWKLFCDAAVYDRRAPGRYKDNFVMDLRYYSPDYALIYTLSIPLANNQDKAEEEIIEAINFYHNASRQEHVTR